MALTAAVALGAVAAIAVPWIAQGQEDVLGGAITGRALIHVPIGGGMELHWSWLVFCVVTLFAWGLLAVTQDR